MSGLSENAACGNTPAPSQEIAQSYIHALTGSLDTVMDWRAIHDRNKGVPAVPFRGTLQECWPTIKHWNDQGYGIFAVPSVLDGQGRKLENVAAIRAHYLDCDSGSVEANVQRAAQSLPAPCFAVISSPGRQHVYWPLSETYRDNDRFQTLQRKLAQEYGGDPQVIDATRVMRLAGTLNHKYAEPHLVTCHALPGFGVPVTVEALEAAYAHVQVIEVGGGTRHDLGAPELTAPSLDWLEYAMRLIDPNELDRSAWIAVTCAVKQAGWSLTDHDTLFAMWFKWCEKYEKNDLAENLKQWKSIRSTTLGWKSLVARVPSLKAAVTFGVDGPGLAPVAMGTPSGQAVLPPIDCSGEVLTHTEQAEYFKGCVYVADRNVMVDANGFVHDRDGFNGIFGGKLFVYTSEGKLTDQPWKAALSGTQWRVPVAASSRFRPDEPPLSLMRDEYGRAILNRYVAPPVLAVEGDPGPFLRHLTNILPDPADQHVLLSWLAHNARWPGDKIPWAPVIQSCEGVGKDAFRKIMWQVLGRRYCHSPDAEDLGNKFNSWLEDKLLIVGDEVKIKGKVDLLEKMKRYISQTDLQLQSKGVDQSMGDNYANWLMFTNYQDAVPISKNGRRYAVFYSALQSEADLIARGMTDRYFRDLFDWLDGDGCAIVAHHLLNYPVTKGSLRGRAPKTSSWASAVAASMSEEATVVAEAIMDGEAGFKGGWVATAAATRVLLAAGQSVAPRTVSEAIKDCGYAVKIGRASRPYPQDGAGRSWLWRVENDRNAEDYAKDQGYE